MNGVLFTLDFVIAILESESENCVSLCSSYNLCSLFVFLVLRCCYFDYLSSLSGSVVLNREFYSGLSLHSGYTVNYGISSPVQHTSNA
jgi:hypothetical protein